MKSKFVILCVLITLGFVSNGFGASARLVNEVENEEIHYKDYQVSVYDNETLLQAVSCCYRSARLDFDSDWTWFVVDCWYNDDSGVTVYKICLMSEKH